MPRAILRNRVGFDGPNCFP